MAERILRSPGVTTRELDLSAPGRVSPQGVPAGIIGTAEKGPAFVPVVFATLNDFTNLFGETKGKHFGAMAVREWMAYARSGLYVRVLGIGDGKKAAATGVVTNAGFVVGNEMRDKDRTDYSKSTALGAAIRYASVETDDAADGPVPNPYAGSGSADVLTLNDAVTGVVGVAAQFGLVTITVTDDTSFSVLDYDGLIISGADQAGTLYGWYLNGKASNVHTVSSLIILNAGGHIVHTFPANTTPQVIDVSAAGDAGAVAAAIRNATAGTFTVGGSGADATFTGDTHGRISLFTITKATGSTATESLLTPVLTQAGDTAVAAEVFERTITIGGIPEDDSFILVTDEGQANDVKIGFHSTGANTVSADIVVNTGAITTANALGTAIVEAVSNSSYTNQTYVPMNAFTITDMQIKYDETTAKLHFQQVNAAANGVTLPTLAKTEANASAPLGRMYFLGAEMVAPQDTVAGITYRNDYLAGTSAKNILRGILMFPSGVIPGLQETASGVAPADINTVAYGTYASGKDQGAADGLGFTSSADNFVMILNGFNNTANYSNVITGSFDPQSEIYFPDVMNTDPTKIQERGHYLHTHYDIPKKLADMNSNGADKAILLPGARSTRSHATGGDYQPFFEDWQQRFDHAYTPWIISQKLGPSPKKLFRFWMLDAGMAGHNQVKISIANIQKSTDLASDYGSFDVLIRNASDNDNAMEVLQQFTNLNLNPSSDRYIARVIGDQNTFFEFDKDEGKQKLVTEGLYPNGSQFVRVQVVDQIEAGTLEASALPIGFQGKHHLVLDGKAIDSSGTITMVEPPLPYRESVSIGSGATKVVDSRFFWGIHTTDVRKQEQKNNSTSLLSLVSNLTKWFPSLGTYKSCVGDNTGETDTTTGATLDANVYNNNKFTLENVWVKCLSGDVANAVDPTQWHEAVYIRDGDVDGELTGTSDHWKDAVNSDKDSTAGYRYLDVAKDFGQTASKKFYKFTVPMQGGWNGLDIFDASKNAMDTLSSFREMDSASSSRLGGPDGSTTAAFRKALDIIAEKSDVDIQLLATPGLRTPGITDYAIDKTEERFDALYIMDILAYDHDNNLITSAAQETSVSYTTQKLADRNIDTSFAATYFPDIVIQDGTNNVIAPPSVSVLGALSLNDSISHPWYAPAGFARGALASAIETQVKLNRTNMDTLYDSDINPITSFPQTGESVVVFGQKTMLQSQSALDRVNVRRLLIDIRRKVRITSNQVLFEPNRESTLARFSALVNPILGRIQQQQGLDRYKVIIDTTTTTQQDVENNTIRGKIFLQPTRSVEFISLDFVVTNAGAEI